VIAFNCGLIREHSSGSKGLLVVMADLKNKREYPYIQNILRDYLGRLLRVNKIAPE